MAFQLGRWQFELRRGLAWLLILAAALAAFELFNFSTTEYALGTFFGARDALGLASWATVLAIAFCGIDFAGLSRLFTPQSEWRKEPKEVWLLTAAWFLGAAMNATMTWWAVTSALSENPALGNELVSREQIVRIVPVFVAALVWMTRIMLIGSMASGGDRFLASGSRAPAVNGPGRAIRSAPPASVNASRQVPLPDRARTGSPSLPEHTRQPAYRETAGAQAFPTPSARPPTAPARASTVRAYAPAREADAPYPTPRRYDTQQVRPAASPDAATAAEQGAARRGGLPLGARATPSPPAPGDELVYVDLE